MARAKYDDGQTEQSARVSTHQSGLGVARVVPKHLALDQLPGDNVRHHHHPASFSFSRNTLPKVCQAFDPNGQLLQVPCSHSGEVGVRGGVGVGQQRKGVAWLVCADERQRILRTYIRWPTFGKESTKTTRGCRTRGPALQR